jgi:hypothetical protein
MTVFHDARSMRVAREPSDVQNSVVLPRRENRDRAVDLLIPVHASTGLVS